MRSDICQQRLRSSDCRTPNKLARDLSEEANVLVPRAFSDPKQRDQGKRFMSYLMCITYLLLPAVLRSRHVKKATLTHDMVFARAQLASRA